MKKFNRIHSVVVIKKAIILIFFWDSNWLRLLNTFIYSSRSSLSRGNEKMKNKQVKCLHYSFK